MAGKNKAWNTANTRNLERDAAVARPSEDSPGRQAKGGWVGQGHGVPDGLDRIYATPGPCSAVCNFSNRADEAGKQRWLGWFVAQKKICGAVFVC